MNEEFLRLLLRQDNEYLCEVYRNFNDMYFVAFIDENQKEMQECKDIYMSIDKELRLRGYWPSK